MEQRRWTGFQQIQDHNIRFITILGRKHLKQVAKKGSSLSTLASNFIVGIQPMQLYLEKPIGNQQTIKSSGILLHPQNTGYIGATKNKSKTTMI